MKIIDCNLQGGKRVSQTTHIYQIKKQFVQKVLIKCQFLSHTFVISESTELMSSISILDLERTLLTPKEFSDYLSALI